MRTIRLLRWKWNHRTHAWVLRSETYLDKHGDIVGVFRTKRAAYRWAETATPPVLDAVIEEWLISS